MKRSRFLKGEKSKPDISGLLGKYIKTESGHIYHVDPNAILTKDRTLYTRHKVAWPSDSLMKNKCAWLPAFVHWSELESGKIYDVKANERRVNPGDKVAWVLNKYNSNIID